MDFTSPILILLAIIVGLVWLYLAAGEKGEPATSLYRGCEALPTPTPVGDPDELAAWDKRTDEI